ncbi:hypothetical protein GTO91_07025 [Heliobacterium undosum]|uniref:Macrocin O-methyltransferase n=1 Tax=Heliomicrobium undosum TaxID=121734 RepID=A0A845L1G2_9FIRM|nr:TylF/MycF/NovP-related O-methyltransferase [Heliomicrobium undosum]MZP29456.1 hypothetical protein [Heliomicrobium undosum]
MRKYLVYGANVSGWIALQMLSDDQQVIGFIDQAGTSAAPGIAGRFPIYQSDDDAPPSVMQEAQGILVAVGNRTVADEIKDRLLAKRPEMVVESVYDEQYVAAFLKARYLLLQEQRGFQMPVELYCAVRDYTMVSEERLDNVYRLTKEAERSRLPGAFVECGVWRGGCAAVMATVAKEAGNGRVIHLFDSFEGLPEPTDLDGDLAKDYSGGRKTGRLETIGKCVGPLDDVRELFFERLAIDETKVRVHRGWFQETLPNLGDEMEPIAILRLDGDWYESTMICLEHLFPRVVPGGYVIIDDYGFWEGCRLAVHEYLERQGLQADLIPIDDCGVYFVKGKS